tara:strand:+ start:121 stop:279 length:159 start_codon:yes stop_codon:yes gene_type:complete
MKTSESKSLNAKPTETESGNTMPPPTPGLAHSNPTTEEQEVDLYDKLYKSLI